MSRSTLIALVIAAVILLAFGVYRSWDKLAWLFSGEAVPQIVGKVDTVPDTIIVQSRPKIVTKWRDRIITKTVPVRVVVSEGVPDTAFALRYARRALAADSARRADSTARQPAPILPPASGTYDGKRFTLWLTRSDGSLMRATAKLKPRFAFFAGYDKGSDTVPLFQGDRFFVRAARETWHCIAPWHSGLITVAGTVIGILVDKDNPGRGALLGGGSGFVGCLAG